MKRKELLDVCRSHNIAPNKKLGQNFLCNQRIVDMIIDASGTDLQDHVLEIGPGMGMVTETLVKKARRVTAVEIDSGMVDYLKEKFNQESSIDIIHGDFLKIDLKDRFSKVISNLPYYCSSEILFNIAKRFSASGVYVMLQKEMANRIIANPGTPEYGALTVNLSFYFDASHLFNIDKKSFHPQPEVTSSFLEFTRKNLSEFGQDEIDLFHNVVKSAFWGRRKTLVKSLSASPHIEIPRVVISQAMEELAIDGKVRGEDLDLKTYIDLTRKLFPISRGT